MTTRIAVSPVVPSSAEAVEPSSEPPVVSPVGLSTAGVDVGVAAQLALVLGAAGPGGLSGLDSDQALRLVEAVESVKAWADSVSIEATAVMVTELESDFSLLAPETLTARGWRVFFRSCRSAAAREIQVATGLPITQSQRRVWLTACEPERTAPLLEAMRAGRVTLARAMTVAEQTQHLDAVTAAAIAVRVLAPLSGPDGVPLPGVAPVSEATFRGRLRTQLVLHHGVVEQAERTHAQAVEGRRVMAEPQRDGTGVLVISGDGPRVSAAQSRVDTIARHLRRGGDARTLDQLRADVATDLLMRGWVPNDPTFAALGTPPVASVKLLVSLPTLLGLDRGVGQISGWGPVPGWQARELATRAGSIWKRLVTDPLTGRAIEVSASSYTVPAGMAEQINARDRTCRAPGCEIPGDRGDLDHCQEWKPDGAGGPTAETNLADLHRGHHNLKTAGFWDSEQSADGTLTWTTATGRTVKTYPYVYDHPDNHPVETSPLEGYWGRRLTQWINPDIPLFNNPFEQAAWSHVLAPVTPQPAQPIDASHHDPSHRVEKHNDESHRGAKQPGAKQPGAKQPDWKTAQAGDPPF